MPWIRVEMIAGRSDAQKAKVAEAITQAMVTHCGCRPEAVSVQFTDVERQNWAFGGKITAAPTTADTEADKDRDA